MPFVHDVIVSGTLLERKQILQDNTKKAMNILYRFNYRRLLSKVKKSPKVSTTFLKFNPETSCLTARATPCNRLVCCYFHKNRSLFISFCPKIVETYTFIKTFYFFSEKAKLTIN